jgi:transcriptional repressor NrdR
MICPKCRSPRQEVLDTRSALNSRAIWRRRECLACGHRWSSYEVYARSLKKPAQHRRTTT